MLRLSQRLASRHLATRRRAGPVRVRRRGRWRHHAPVEAPKGIRLTLLGCAASCLREVDVLGEDLARRGDASTAMRCRGCWTIPSSRFGENPPRG